MATHEEIQQAKEALAEMKKTLRDFIAQPQRLDDMSPVELAWLKEHFEMLIEETKKLQARLEKLIRQEES
jgi:ubiquinone biosynthesis protein UbiJ